MTQTTNRTVIVLIMMMLTTMTAWANDAVTYIDMDGKTKTVTEYTEVTTDMNLSWSTGTYVVKSSVTLNGCIRFGYPAVIDLIVCDGATLTVNGNEGNGAFNGNTLNIYAQSNGTDMGVVNVKKQTKCNHLNIAGGKVTLDDDGVGYGLYVFSGDANGLTVNGGDVTIQNSDDLFGAIYFAGNGFVTLNGGKLTVTNSIEDGYTAIEGQDTNTINFNGGTAVINGKIRDFNNINLNSGNVTVNGEIFNDWGYTVTYDFTRATDSYYINAFSNDLTRTVQVKDGAAFLCNGKSYSGTLSADEIAAISDQRMTPDISNHFSVNDAGTEYTIHTATGWGYFCDMQEGGETFSGKTIVLDGDIGTPEAPVTRMGSSTTQFQGTFDGQGHTLTMQYGTASEPVNQQFVAPFPKVAGAATFRNLTIAGSIYSGYATSVDKGTGGLIGCLFGGVTVEHCVSTVTVNAASDRAGGFVGHCEHAVTFTDCVSSATVTCTGSGSGFVGWSRDSKYTIAFYGCLFDGKVLKQGTVGSGNGSFVGWKGFSKTIEITNCLVDPAALTQDETMASDNSATFCRYSADTTKDNQATTITNSYYTATLGAAQGKARHTVTAGTDVTVAHAGVATHYATSGITAYKATGASADSDPFIAGLLYNNNVVDVLYAGSGDQLSLTLSKTATGAPQGYRYDGYATSAGTLSGTTLTMPDADVTVNVDTETLRSTRQPVTVAYINADGTTSEASAIALDGHEAVRWDGSVYLAAGTYYVGTDIAYANRIRPDGNITLILANGKTMTLNGNTIGIGGDCNLTIYGQSLDAATAGTLRYDGTKEGINANNYEQHSGNVSITTAGFLVKGISAYVTLRGGTLTISASGSNACAISGTTHSILGGQLTATATGINPIGIYAYASSGTAITLGWARPDDRITASSISIEDGTVAVADGKVFTDGNGHNFYGTITDVSTLADKTLQPVTNAVPYIDADGNTAYCFDYTVLTGGGATTLAPGWYVVNSTISYTATLTFGGDITLILCDGCEMKVGESGAPIENAKAIDGYVNNGEEVLTIYGQALGTGTLKAYVSGYRIKAINADALTVNGGNITASGAGEHATAIYTQGAININRGTVTATATSDESFGIYAYNGTVNINGGTVTANGTEISIYGNAANINGGTITANGGGIYVDGENGDVAINGGNVTASSIYSGGGTITLGWRTADDRITVSSISTGGGTVAVADGKALVDTSNGNKYYIGDGNAISASDINGKTLKPALLLTDNVDNSAQVAALDGIETAAILYGRTLYKDGAWNTLCLPFDVTVSGSVLDGTGVQAMTLNSNDSGLSGTTLTLNFSDAPATIPAGTPFIVKWGDKDEPSTLEGLTDLTAPVFTNVTVSNANNDVAFTGGAFKGTYASITYEEENKSILFVGGNNSLYWPTADASIGAQRAYFELNDGEMAREFKLNFGEETTGVSLTSDPSIPSEARPPVAFPTGEGRSAAYYTLDGRKLSGKPTAPGIYVKDGHKVAIKREK